MLMAIPLYIFLRYYFLSAIRLGPFDCMDVLIAFRGCCIDVAAMYFIVYILIKNPFSIIFLRTLLPSE